MEFIKSIIEQLQKSKKFDKKNFKDLNTFCNETLINKKKQQKVAAVGYEDEITDEITNALNQNNTNNNDDDEFDFM